MSLSIHTNFASLVTQNTLNKNNSMLSTAMQRLGTGFRVNSAADDAAGLQIATRLSAQSRGMGVAQRNAQDAISLLQTAEGAFSEMTDILQRMKDLATQASSDTNSTADRTAMKAEFDELAKEITNVLSNTKYAGESLFAQGGTGGTTTIEIAGKYYLAKDDATLIDNNGGDVALAGLEAADLGKLVQVAAGTSYKIHEDGDGFVNAADGSKIAFTAFDGTLDNLAVADGAGKLMKEFNLQIGSSSSETLTIDLKDSLTSLSNAIAAGSTGALDTHEGATAVMDALEKALNAVGTVRSSLGANINRLEHTSNNLANMQANTDMAKGRIMDADFAAESSVMTKQQMLMQSGISVLGNSNQLTGLVASLLR